MTREEEPKRGGGLRKGRKPEEAAVSPPLKARKFEKYVDDVPRGGEWTEHLLKIPEGQ